MFSATKFVIAGALVALFGGFLLSGVLTQPSEEQLLPAAASASSSPELAATLAPTTTNPDLLPGVDLVAEEVEPGVFRVVNDGHRDVAWVGDPVSYTVRSGGTVPGRDGGVWIFTLPVAPDDDCRATIRGEDPDRYGCMTFYRLGSPETHRLTDGSVASSVAVADGTVWADNLGLGQLRSFSGMTWVDHRIPDNYGGFVMGSDGSIWALWPDQRDRERVGHLTAEGWDVSSPGQIHQDRPVLFAGVDGDLFIAEHDGDIRRVDGIDRTPNVAKADDLDLGNSVPRQGGDAFWWMVAPDSPPKRIVRFDGSEYTSYDNPLRGEGQVRGVAPDGAAWLAGGLLSLRCDGIVRFDGSKVSHFLSGKCPVSTAIAADGTVWVQAIPSAERYEQASIVDTYVITPEAVAAAE